MQKEDNTPPRMIRPSRLRPEIGGYLGTPLHAFYMAPAYRLLLYTLTFILSGVAAFGAVWIYDMRFGLPYYNDIPLAFKGMYAWHTAANFAICFMVVDILVTSLYRVRGRMDQWTVGKTWLVFFIAFIIGFTFQRTVVYQWVDLYYPKLILRHEAYPSERPGALSMFVFMLPFGIIIGYFLIRFILSVQARAEELLRVRVDTILEERASLPNDLKPSSLDIPADETMLSLPLDADVGPIRSFQITQITAEDHYLRIHYRVGEIGQETLIRMSLKELASRLPADRFFRIHRSHIVNLQWVDGVKRAGREVRLKMADGAVELPVSRYRLPQLLPILDRFLKRPSRRLTSSA